MMPTMIVVMSFCGTTQPLLPSDQQEAASKVELLNSSIQSMRLSAQRTKNKIDRALATLQERGIPITDPEVQLLIRLQTTYKRTIDSLQGVEAGKDTTRSPQKDKKTESKPKPK